MIDDARTRDDLVSSSRVSRHRGPVRTAFGVGAAIVAMQLGLMPLSTGVHRDWDSINRDTEKGPAVTQRWYYEGLATSHFSNAGARLTGNVSLPGAITGVIMGDSYVEARQLDDRSTIGSVVERSARQDGVRLNVRQYGVSGASAAEYAGVAGEVLDRWTPAFVAVILTEDDFVNRAPFLGDYALDLRPDSTVAIQHAPRSRGLLARRVRNAGAYVLERITLLDKIVVRAARITEGATSRVGTHPAVTRRAANLPDSAAVYASVKALREGYGAPLAIIYVPTVGAVSNEDDFRNEMLFLATCSHMGVRCASARETLVRDRARQQRVSRGFTNTTPGTGHLNAVGAELVGRLAWTLVRGAPTIGAPARQ